MSVEVLIILFVILSLVSALINKVQEYKRSQEPERPKSRRSSGGRGRVAPEEEEIDLSEWEMFPEFEAAGREVREGPAAEAPPEKEFREVKGTRPVTEVSRGPEFREVKGTRPVTEVSRGPEFREVKGARPVTEVPGEWTRSESRRTAGQPAPVERPAAGSGRFSTPVTRPMGRAPAPIRTSEAPAQSLRKAQRRRRRLNLDTGTSSLRRAVLYREILGPPRAEEMPW